MERALFSGSTNLELCFTKRWPPADKLRAFFDASPCLERLAIYDDIEALLKNINPRPFMAIIDLRHLKHLTIEVYRVPESADVDVALFIKLFSFPRLDTLSLRGQCISELVVVWRRSSLSGRFCPSGEWHIRRRGIANVPLCSLPHKAFRSTVATGIMGAIGQRTSSVEMVEIVSRSLPNWTWLRS